MSVANILINGIIGEQFLPPLGTAGLGHASYKVNSTQSILNGAPFIFGLSLVPATGGISKTDGVNIPPFGVGSIINLTVAGTYKIDYSACFNIPVAGSTPTYSSGIELISGLTAASMTIIDGSTISAFTNDQTASPNNKNVCVANTILFIPPSVPYIIALVVDQLSTSGIQLYASNGGANITITQIA